MAGPRSIASGIEALKKPEGTPSLGNPLGVPSTPLTAEATQTTNPKEEKKDLAKIALDDPEVRELAKEMRDEVDRKFDKREQDVQRRRAIELITQSITQLGAAMAGQRTGVDLSNLKFVKQDFEKELDRLAKRRESGQETARQTLSRLVAERKERRGSVEEAKRRKEDVEFREKKLAATKGKESQAKPVLQTREVLDPKTGKSAIKSFLVTPEGVKEIGELGETPPNLIKDPSTGEWRNKHTGELIKAEDSEEIVKTIGIYGKLPKKGKDLINKLSDKFAMETKQARKGLDTIQGIESSVDAAMVDEIAASQLGARLAQLFEEGRLTDEDVKRYGVQKSVLSRVDNLIEELAAGTITEDRAKEIKRSLVEFENAVIGALEKRANEKARTFAARYEVTAEEVTPLIFEVPAGTRREVLVDMITPDGRTFRVPFDKVKAMEAKGAEQQ